MDSILTAPNAQQWWAVGPPSLFFVFGSYLALKRAARTLVSNYRAQSRSADTLVDNEKQPVPALSLIFPDDKHAEFYPPYSSHNSTPQDFIDPRLLTLPPAPPVYYEGDYYSRLDIGQTGIPKDAVQSTTVTSNLSSDVTQSPAASEDSSDSMFDLTPIPWAHDTDDGFNAIENSQTMPTSTQDTAQEASTVPENSRASFVCTYPGCNKRFADRRNLKYHQNRHNPQRQCDICSMKVADQKELMRHKAKAHGEFEMACPFRSRGCHFVVRGREDAMIRHLNGKRHIEKYGRAPS